MARRRRTSVSAIEISAPPTSSIVLWAACKGDMPARMLRSTFSTTTIASSTTMPTASTRPNSDRLLSEMPKATRIVNVPTSETGIAMTGMMAARQFWRNRNTTPTTRRIATKIVTTTSWIDLRDEDRRIVDDRGSRRRAESLSSAPASAASDFMFDGERVGAGLRHRSTGPWHCCGPCRPWCRNPRRRSRPGRCRGRGSRFLGCRT